MMNDEKMCPLTKMTCYGAECAWWSLTQCVAIDVAQGINTVGKELLHARTELGYIRKDLEQVERKL